MASSSSIDFGWSHPLPYHLSEWICRHSSRLLPPVCNAMIHSSGCEFKVMVVGGPNVRRDFHKEDGEEWFYQIKGDMVLRIEDNGEFKDIVIQEGESYLLPANIPHSPQRLSDTIGIVIERERMANEFDSLRWYCNHCGGAAILFETRFRCVELGTQVKEAIESYYGNEEIRKCKRCGNIDQMPDKPAREKELLQVIANHKLLSIAQKDAGYATGKSWINRSTHPAPLGLQQWINDNRSLLAPPVGNKMIYSDGTQFKVMVVGGPNLRTDYHIEAGEEWFYQLQGDMILKIVDHSGQFRDILIQEGEAFLLPANVPHSPQRFPNTIGLVIERQRLSSDDNRELDHIRWYCPNPSCREPLKTFTFYCEDLGTQLVPIIHRWYSEEMADERKCKKCGSVDIKPDISKATTAKDAMSASLK